MVKKRGLWVFLLVILSVGAGIQLYRMFSDEFRIQAILHLAEEAVEHEDAEGVLAILAPDYEDTHHLTFASVRDLLKRIFKEFDHFEVISQKPEIQVRGNTAKVMVPLNVLVDWAGQRSYLVGGNSKPARVSIAFRKDGYRWVITRVDGVK